MYSTDRLSETADIQWIMELRKHLEPVLSAAKRVDRMRQDFQKSYHSWLPLNDDAVELITEVKKQIISVNRCNTSVSTVTATCGTAGVILFIIGAATIVFTGRTSLLLTGCVVFAGSAVFSIGSNKRKDSINEILCKEATEGLKKYSEGIVSLEKKCLGYFRALDYFNSFLNMDHDNHLALSLFREAVNDRAFDLSGDLRVKDQERVTLRKIMTSEVKTNPRVQFLERVGHPSSQSVVQEVREVLKNIVVIIKNDPYLLQVFRDKMKSFLIKKAKEREAQFAIMKALTTEVTAPPAKLVRVRILLIQAIQLTSLVFDVVSVIEGIVSLTKATEIFDQPDQCKEVTDYINGLKEIRNDVTEGMRDFFGWQSFR